LNDSVEVLDDGELEVRLGEQLALRSFVALPAQLPILDFLPCKKGVDRNTFGNDNIHTHDFRAAAVILKVK
jgi:hypothetical protein